MQNNWLTTIKIAHRGLHNEEFPENSLGAFENACKFGFAIELDVQLTRDNHVVVFHDDNLERLCNVKKTIQNSTLSELQEYKLLNSSYTIPTLHEVLALVDKRTPILIELKSSKPRSTIAKHVYSIIKDYPGQLAIKSFNPMEVIWFKKHAPEITRGMLASFLEDINFPRIYKLMIRSLAFYKQAKPHFISYNIFDLPNKYVSRHNVPILTWTITSPTLESEALKIADNIIFENYTPEQSQIGV